MGPEHYKEAERLLGLASGLDASVLNYATKNGITSEEMRATTGQSANFIAAALVHATLAHAAAVVEADGGISAAWQTAVYGEAFWNGKNGADT